MTRVLKSEFIKVASVRATYVSAAVLTAIALTAANMFTSPVEVGRWVAMQDHPGLAIYVTVIGLFAYAYGTRSITDEYRYRTVTPTLLVTPGRERVLAAKTVASAAVGSLTAAVAVGATLAIVLPWAAGGSQVDFTTGDALTVGASVVAVAAMFAVLGVGIGALVRHPVAAIIGGFGWFAMIEPALPGYLNGFVRFLPGQAAASMMGMPGPHGYSRLGGAAVFAAYVAVALVAGAIAVRRRDVN